MLREYIETVHNENMKKQAHRQFVDELKQLPLAELVALSRGEVHPDTAGVFEKRAYGQSDGEWLSKYKGTPLLGEAVALEQQLIEAEIADRTENAELRMLRERTCLQKRLLDLKLAVLEGGESADADAPSSAGTTVRVGG